MRYLTLSVMLLMLSGCGLKNGFVNTASKYPPPPPPPTTDQIVNSWRGHNVNDLVAAWGYPTREFKAQMGGIDPAWMATATTIVGMALAAGQNLASRTPPEGAKQT